MVAVGLAMKTLRMGDTNLALACGANLLNFPFTTESLEPVLSPTYRCKTFDKDADGFARGEGCGVLVLKRLSEAIRDGDVIHGILQGYGEAQEGTSTSMGTPSADVQAEAMSLALKDAGVPPRHVSFLEAHGTGTVLGDPIEMYSISKAYSAGRKEPLIVASVKPNIGHTEAASGIAGIIKTLLSMKYGIIPPHIGCKNLNPHIDLNLTPAIIPMEAVVTH